MRFEQRLIVQVYSLEGSDCENETFERSVFNLVPNTSRVLWGLLTVKVLNLGSTESEEISELYVSVPLSQHCVRETAERGMKTNLRGSVDFSLPYVLSLSEHSSSADLGTVFARDQISSLRVVRVDS